MFAQPTNRTDRANRTELRIQIHPGYGIIDY